MSRKQCVMLGGKWYTRAGVWKAKAEGTWEKVQTHRRHKVPLLGQREEKGWANAIENSLCPSMPTLDPAIAEGRLSLAQHTTPPEVAHTHSGPHPDLQEATHHVVACQAMPQSGESPALLNIPSSCPAQPHRKPCTALPHSWPCLNQLEATHWGFAVLWV